MNAVCALETSARPPSVALAAAGRQLDARLSQGRRHASDLLPTLATLLEELGCGPRDLELVCVGIGPGSYTGLRVGVATALGLARGADAAVVVVPSVAALAHDVLEPGQEASVLLDARARQFYFARYRREAQGVVELEAPRVVRAEQLPALLDAPGPILGDPTVADAADLGARDRGRLWSDRVPTARSVLALGRLRLEREGTTPLEEVAPLYLRPFAASKRRR